MVQKMTSTVGVPADLLVALWSQLTYLWLTYFCQDILSWPPCELMVSADSWNYGLMDVLVIQRFQLTSLWYKSFRWHSCNTMASANLLLTRCHYLWHSLSWLTYLWIKVSADLLVKQWSQRTLLWYDGLSWLTYVIMVPSDRLVHNSLCWPSCVMMVSADLLWSWWSQLT
jgi:hypothetical protein